MLRDALITTFSILAFSGSALALNPQPEPPGVQHKMRQGTHLPPGPGIAPAHRAQSDGGKNDKDSMSEMGEQEQLKMQMQMDRRSKAQQTLSNVMKKSSDTEDTITVNMK